MLCLMLRTRRAIVFLEKLFLLRQEDFLTLLNDPDVFFSDKFPTEAKLEDDDYVVDPIRIPSASQEAWEGKDDQESSDYSGASELSESSEQPPTEPVAKRTTRNSEPQN